MLLISFILAYFIHGKYAKMKKLFKTLIFMPQIMATVTSVLIFRILFATHAGVINSLLGTSIGFLDPANPILMKISVVILIMWKGIGWYMIIFLSGLSGLDTNILESAIIDGVGPLQNLWHMIFPLMRPILLLALVFETIGSLKLSIEPNLLLSGGVAGAPSKAAPVINLVLNNIQGGSFGMASAAGWIITIIIFTFTIIQMYMSAREE
jgi:ABC-type sugar transport system permease subunit